MLLHSHHHERPCRQTQKCTLPWCLPHLFFRHRKTRNVSCTSPLVARGAATNPQTCAIFPVIASVCVVRHTYARRSINLSHRLTTPSPAAGRRYRQSVNHSATSERNGAPSLNRLIKTLCRQVRLTRTCPVGHCFNIALVPQTHYIP